jgi:hypothetical protein
MIVFDNADDIEMWTGTSSQQKSSRLIDYLPKSKQGTIILQRETGRWPSSWHLGIK